MVIYLLFVISGSKLPKDKVSDRFDMSSIVRQDQGKDSGRDRRGCQKMEKFEERTELRGKLAFVNRLLTLKPHNVYENLKIVC